MKASLLLSFFVFFTLLVCAQKKDYTSADGTRYRLAFQDEFNGKHLDKKKWNYRTDSKHWSTQMPENVKVSHGYLYLKIKKENIRGKEYTGAGIISKKAFGYGYYEARFKVPPGAGWHSSFWLMFSDGSGGTGTSKAGMEYDICENDSKNKNVYGVNFHNWKMDQHFGQKDVRTPNLADDFHIWGCEVKFDKVNYYFDGKLVQSVDGRSLPHDPLNVWLTTIASFSGNTTTVDEGQLPSAAIFDYVRYYKMIN
ncbi:MAG: glycoside hydrolase family 16 protein [Ginsengibacter sp.]